MKKWIALALTCLFLLPCCTGYALADSQSKETNWTTSYAPNQDLVERKLMEDNGLSVVAKQVQFAKDDKLKVYLEIYNTNKKPYDLYLNYVLINGWAMENELFADAEANLGSVLTVPAMSSVPAYIYVSFPYVTRFSEMEITDVTDVFISILACRNGKMVFEIKSDVPNPDADGNYCQTYFDDGKELYKDNRIRVVYQGKDTTNAMSAYFIENYRNIDDWPLIYETILGNTITDHVASNRGEDVPSTFFLPAESKRLLWGPDIQAYCKAADLELPTVADIGLLFNNTNPITARVEVPGGTNVASWDFRTASGNIIYQDKDARVFYAGVYDDGEGGELKLVFENINPKYHFCLQAHNGTGRLDGQPVWVDMDYNVAAPGARCVVFAKLSFADGSPLDLKEYQQLVFDVWPQKRTNADWLGNYGHAQVNIWDDCK